MRINMREDVREKMRAKKLCMLLVIATWTIVVAGCNKAKVVNNMNGIETAQSTSGVIQTVPDTEQSETIQMPSQTNIEESSSQIVQEVSINPNSNIATNNDTEAPQIKSETKANNTDFVSNLNISNSVSQMIVVAASGSTATVTMHEIQNGEWTQIMSTQGYVGIEGVASAAKVNEGTKITPTGIYTLSIAFGVKDEPTGTTLPYTKVDDSNYWVDDPNSKYYNTFVSTNDPNVVPDWNSAEYLKGFPTQYAYAIAIDYNLGCKPNAGSAIFLHCSNVKSTYGCVSIPDTEMIFVLQHIRSGCVIVIDTASEINKY